MVKAKKHLGQHFLINEEVTKQIADALLYSDKYNEVLEVGPGTGAVTKYLMEKDFNLSVVEVDQESIHYLQQHYPDLAIINEDFLKLDTDAIYKDKPIGVVGNFPYYISSQILFKAYENRDKIIEVVGMFQKEVAVRIAAAPGNKTYGILSVLLQAFYDIDYLFTVHEDSFDPPPKVKSSVIRLTRNKVKGLDCDEKLFKQVVKAGFGMRRKTLRNSLKPLLTDEIKGNEIFNKRPEQLSVQEFVGITQLIDQERKKNL